jgi:iron complex transport system substrate-binding protein
MVRIAGGEDLFAGPGEPSARLTWHDVFEAAPEVLVLMPCGFDARRTVEEARRILPALPGWTDLPAVRNGRVWAVDANSYFSRPAPRLVEGVEILARILHPEALPGETEPAAISQAYALEYRNLPHRRFGKLLGRPGQRARREDGCTSPCGPP